MKLFFLGLRPLAFCFIAEHCCSYLQPLAQGKPFYQPLGQTVDHKWWSCHIREVSRGQGGSRRGTSEFLLCAWSRQKEWDAWFYLILSTTLWVGRLASYPHFRDWGDWGCPLSESMVRKSYKCFTRVGQKAACRAHTLIECEASSFEV